MRRQVFAAAAGDLWAERRPPCRFWELSNWAGGLWPGRGVDQGPAAAVAERAAASSFSEMAGDSPTASSELEEVGAAHYAATDAADREPVGAEAAGGGGGGGAAADGPSPRSPSGGFIPAIKRQEGTTFDLQAWPSELGGHFFTTTLDGGASEPAPAQPAWWRAWQR